jgi:hypothetical protein
MPVPPTHSLRSHRPSRDPPISLAQVVPSSARRRAARRKSQESCVSGQKRHKTSSSPSRVEPRVDAPTRTLHISAPAPKGRRTCARIAAWTQCIATAKGRGQRVLRHDDQLPLLGRACRSLVHREPGSRRSQLPICTREGSENPLQGEASGQPRYERAPESAVDLSSSQAAARRCLSVLIDRRILHARARPPNRIAQLEYSAAAEFCLSRIPMGICLREIHGIGRS